MTYSLRKIVLVSSLAFIVLFFGCQRPEPSSDQTPPNENQPETPKPESVKKAQVVVFGQWDSEKSREVLGTVEREKETIILAEASGSIDEVYVSIGDQVGKGQLLARFKKSDDPTQINYENALRNLETAKVSAENSIRSMEISLENAQRELDQLYEAQAQTHKKTFNELRTAAKNTETTAQNVLDWADKILGASNRFRTIPSPTYHRLGGIDSIKKNDTKNRTESLVLRRNNLYELPPFGDITDNQVLIYAEERLNFLVDIRFVVGQMEDLIERTRIQDYFSAETQNGFLQQAEGYAAGLDQSIAGLESAIEGSKSANDQIEQSILKARNGIKNLEAQLELTKSQSENSVAQIRNQVILQSSFRNDLEVRAPYDGVINDKMISEGQQVAQGQTQLFSIANEEAAVRIAANLTKEELERIRNQSSVVIKLSNNQRIQSEKKFISNKFDPISQTARVEFLVDTDSMPEGVTNGSFVTVLIPTKNGVKNLLPISAISFEPDGEEILVLDDENRATRQKVTIGRIIADAIEILDGLQPGQKVIEYRNRVSAGEKIDPQGAFDKEKQSETLQTQSGMAVN